MAKVAGAIDSAVRLLETIIQVAPMFKFHNAAGKEIPIRDLAGLARSLQAATSVRQGAAIDLSVVRPLETRLASIQSDVDAMLTQLARQ
ncbi:MAG TPA: hypothetical protein VFW44_21725 [Bryobacteraceae bacterium]|nr:hypothetical protein [Bryobacteraceae bacterium]